MPTILPIKDAETNRIKKAVIYNIVEIDMDGRKSLLSYYIYFGCRKQRRLVTDTE